MDIYIECTSVSCGVDQIYGFEYLPHNTGMETVEKKIADKIIEQADDGYSTDRHGELPCAMYVFSDIKGALGDRFGQYLMKKYARSMRIRKIEGRNPNSGNQIVTYLWKPTIRWIEKFPDWKEVLRENKKRAREWSMGDGWY